MNGSRVCAPAELERFAHAIIQSMGADDEVAGEVAGHLVRANLVGHDSHGVLRLPQYVAQAAAGELAPAARPVLLRESAVTALLDGRQGFGHFATRVALDWAITHARAHGLAAVAVRHAGHIGRLGEYAERAVGQGLIAIVTVGAAGPGAGVMAPQGSQQRFLGPNPWAIGVPASGHPPLIVDISTSAIAEGKVRLARAMGVPLPPGCISDRDGHPSTDPADFYAGGTLLPVGGETSGHKGYGLALASALIGGLAMIGDDAPSLISGPPASAGTGHRGHIGGVFLAVVDPATFATAGDYTALVGDTLAAATRVPPARGVQEVLVPGEPEVRTRRQRTREGIPLPDATWHDLVEVATRFGVSLPAAS